MTWRLVCGVALVALASAAVVALVYASPGQASAGDIAMVYAVSALAGMGASAVVWQATAPRSRPAQGDDGGVVSVSKWVWVNLRVAVHLAIHCMAMSADSMPNERGTYAAWFCDRWPWHRGDHRDSRYPRARWARTG